MWSLCLSLPDKPAGLGKTAESFLPCSGAWIARQTLLLQQGEKKNKQKYPFHAHMHRNIHWNFVRRKGAVQQTQITPAGTFCLQPCIFCSFFGDFLGSLFCKELSSGFRASIAARGWSKAEGQQDGCAASLTGCAQHLLQSLLQ